MTTNRNYIDALMKIFEENRFLKDDEKDLHGKFLFGYKGKLYTLESDFQIAQNIMPYDKWFDSVGCGDEYALGAMSTYLNLINEPKPENVIKSGLDAANVFSRSVCPPFNADVLPYQP